MYLCFAKRFSKRRISLASGFYDVRTIIIFSYCFKKQKLVYQCFPGGDSGKEPACQCRRCRRCGFDPWVGKLPWRRRWQPSPVFLSEKSHGQKIQGKHQKQKWFISSPLLRRGYNMAPVLHQVTGSTNASVRKQPTLIEDYILYNRSSPPAHLFKFVFA